MLNGGDFDLNFAYNCTNALKQRLKQTMLNQELVFMRQVYELHRLYRVQIAMMEDFKWKGLGNNIMHEGGVKSFSEIKNNQAQCSMVDLTRSGKSNLQQALFGFAQKPLDLQLSADKFISHCVDGCQETDPLRDSLMESIESKNFFRGITVSDLDNLKLSLSIGQDAGNKIKGQESSTANKACTSSSVVIDLEDPYFGFSKNDACPELAPGFTTSKISPRDQHKLEGFSQIGIKDVSYGNPVSKSFLVVDSSCQRHKASQSGFTVQHGESLFADILSKNQTSGTCNENNLDLNMSQHEDSSCFSSIYPIVHNPSRIGFSGVVDKVYAKSTIVSFASPTSCSKHNVKCQTEPSDIHRQFDLNYDLAQSSRDLDIEEWNNDDKSRLDDECKISFVDLDSDANEHLCSSRYNPKYESVDSSSKLSIGLSCDVNLVDAVEAEANVKRDAEPLVPSHPFQNQMAAEHSIGHKLPAPSESDYLIDHQSGSLKTMQSVAKCGDSNFSSSDECQKANIGHLGDNSGDLDQRSSDSTESKIQHISRNESEVDEMIQTAAESLMQIFLETQASYQEGGLTKEFQDEEEQPQRSLESYEAMVLRAKESDPDDYCVSSNAFIVDESVDKCSRYKLKRGTRMKDFQKDVLPCLSILSRHEIREDITIMEGVIRSREYRKMRAKMGGVGDWIRPARSKRSRVGCSRRYYP